MEYSIPPDGEDYSESNKVRITCYALDKSIRLVMVKHAPDDLSPSDSIYFYVDNGSHLESAAELAQWGYVGAMPSGWVWPDLLKQMMRGRKLEIRFKRHTNEVFYELDLTGTRKSFRRHMSACLR